jgi:nucleotide-binding universal stress UspA family protein
MTRDAFRLLVATDGSPHARAALATAVRFPWPEGTRASAVTVRPVPTGARRSILLAALDRTADAAAARARRALALRWPDADVAVVSSTPVSGILREARRIRADVIVLGWRGVGGLRAVLMGSVSRGVTRRATASVLVVKGRRRDIRRIVVGLDGSANARRALAFVRALPAPRGGHVTLCTAVDRMRAPAQGLAPRGVRASVAAEVARINAQREAEARTALEHAASALRRAGWRVKTVLRAGPPLRELLRTIDAAHADLLVVGARGTSGVQHLFLGSVADGALNRCPAPVLVVR